MNEQERCRDPRCGHASLGQVGPELRRVRRPRHQGGAEGRRLDWKDVEFIAGGDTMRNGYPGYVAGATFAKAMGWTGHPDRQLLRRLRHGRPGDRNRAHAHPRRHVRRRRRGRRRHHAQGLPRAQQGRAHARPGLAALPPAGRHEPDLLRTLRPPSHGPLRRHRAGLRPRQGEEQPPRRQANPNARYKKVFTEEEVLASPMVADPLRLFEICATSDGGAAVVLTSMDFARKHGVADPSRSPPCRRSRRRSRTPDRHAELRDRLRRGHAGARPRLQGLDRPRRLRRGGPRPGGLDLAEVYDLSSALELDWYENIGLCKPGEAGAPAARRRHHHRRPDPGERERRPRLLRRGRARPRRSPRSASSPGSCAARPANARSRAPRPASPRTRASSATARPSIVHALVRRPLRTKTYGSEEHSNMAEAYIIDAVRTPVGKREGGLAGVHSADLGAHVAQGMMDRERRRPGRRRGRDLRLRATPIGSQAGDIARTCWLAAGLPDHVPGVTIDRQCGSSQQSVHFAAQAVMSGTSDLIVAGGVQNMSQIPISSAMTCRRAPGLHRPVLGLEGLGRSLRRPGSLAVPRRRDDRREVGHHAATTWRTLRARESRARDPRDRRGALRARDPALRRRRPPTRAAPGHPREDGQSLRTLVEGGRITAAVASQISDGACRDAGRLRGAR